MTDRISASPLSPAPEYRPCTSRLATPEERLYLRRFNGLRLMRYLMFWMIFVFFGALAGLFIWLAVTVSIEGDLGMALFMSGLALFLPTVCFFWWRPVLPDLIRMRPVLRVPARVEVICCHDRLATIIHETGGERNLYRLFRRPPLLELPSHWENMALRCQYENPDIDHPVEIARLPGASGKVLRLTMYHSIGRYRIDPILPDLGDFVLRFGDLSIAREMRARLPVIRASESFGGFAFASMLLGLIATLLCWIWLDLHNTDAERLAAGIAHISASYDAGGAVPVAGLAARGIGDLRPDPEFGQRALYAAPVTLHEVRLPGGGTKPFYLTEAEFSFIPGISAVFPRNLSGYGQPSDDAIAEYRALLMARIETFGTVPPAMAQRLASLPDAVIARQLRALSLGNSADQGFVAALLPQPMILRAPETNPYFIRAQPFCYSRDTLCGQRDAPVTYADAVFTAQDGAVILQTSADLRRLAEQRAELAALNAETGPYRALVACIGVVLLAALAWLASWQAAWRIGRWYRKQAAHPPG
ncbi:MAG: hypothetical protein Q4G25_04490 [Paracoccus sp. (in: a-proteobacteria)]|nr:hypothetical protein [Paracoccus sp. (in: a-proteobacteria)]